MHTTGAPHTATTSTPVPSEIGGNPVRPGRRLRTRIGAAALIGSSLMIGACGSVDSPLDPQPAAAAEAPVAFCRVISLVPNAQYGPLLHRQEPGVPTPSDAGPRPPVPLRRPSVPVCSDDGVSGPQHVVAPNPDQGPLQHRLDR